MRIDILTLFPAMFSCLDASMVRRARDAGLIDLHITNIRDYATDKWATTDDRLYGGGAGMVLKPEPLTAAVEAAIASSSVAKPRVVVTSPAGRPYTQALAQELAQAEQVIVICGHYEGIDQRAIDLLATDVVSIGDFVLTGGEIAACAIADSVARLIPGVLGDARATEEESFSDGLLEYPQYTRPPLFRGKEVPAVLQNGDHKKIAAWRRERSLERTLAIRPDLLPKARLTEKDAAFLGELRRAQTQPLRFYCALVHDPVLNQKKRVVATPLVETDLHDIARLAKTYALSRFFVVQPSEEQQTCMEAICAQWQSRAYPSPAAGKGQAELAPPPTLLPDLASVIAAIEAECGEAPRLIAADCSAEDATVCSLATAREQIQHTGGVYLLLLASGYSLVEELRSQAAICLLPLYGRAGCHDLTTRSTAAILLDRLLGDP